MPGIIFRKDGTILNTNIALEQLYGEQVAQLVNRSTIEELFTRRQRKRVIDHYQKITITHTKSTQFIFQRSNGEERIVELNIRSIDDNNLLHATINDITENITYEKRIQQLVNQISVINEIVAAINSNVNKNQLIQVFVNQIGKIFKYDLICMLLCDIEDRELEIHLSRDPSEIESRKAIGLFCQSLAKALLSCHRIEQDETVIFNVADVVGLQLEEKYGSQILIQLKADEQLIGAVMLFSCKENALTQFHVDIFQEISGQIAIAFMKSRLLHRYQQSLTNLSFLAKINEMLSSSLDLDVVLKQLVESSQQIMQAKISTIHFLKDADNSNGNKAWNFADKFIDLLKPQIQQVILNQRPLIVENVDYNSIQFFKNRLDIQKLDLKSLIILPVIKDGKTIALLSVFLDKIHYFSDHEVEFLSMLADQAAIAIRNAEIYEQVEKSKNFLESIIHSSNHIIVSTDLEGKTTFFNHGACINTGYSVNEVLNSPFFERFIKNGRALFEGLKHELLTRKKPQLFDCEISGKNGQSIRITWSFAPLIDQQNEIIGTLGIGREISKQKKMKRNISLASNLNFS